MNPKETQEGYFIAKWKNVAAVVAAIVVVSNTFTGIVATQNNTIETIRYNKERSDRKLQNTIKLIELKDDKEDLEKENKYLKEQLKKCKQ